MVVSSQSKTYQQVIAPFDGVVTQRNFDIGGLITADATSGTSMFSLVHRNVIGLRAAGRRPGVAYEDGVGVSTPLAHQCRTGLSTAPGSADRPPFSNAPGMVCRRRRSARLGRHGCAPAADWQDLGSADRD